MNRGEFCNGFVMGLLGGGGLMMFLLRTGMFLNVELARSFGVCYG